MARTSFKDLPPEIRNIVYGYCLQVGEVYPYLESQRAIDVGSVYGQANSFEVPCTALLAVCKLLHDEAEPLLYKKNTIVLPAAALSAKFFSNSMHSDTRRAWIKSIQLDLSLYDLSKDEKLGIYNEELLSLQVHLVHTDWTNISLDEEDSVRDATENWGRNIHQRYKDRLRFVCWPKMMSPILEHLQLDKLVVNFEDSICSHNCCSIPRRAGAAFNEGFAKGVPTFLVLGNIQEGLFPHTDYKRSIEQDIRRWTADRHNNMRMSFKAGVSANSELLECLDNEETSDGQWAP